LCVQRGRGGGGAHLGADGKAIAGAGAGGGEDAEEYLKHHVRPAAWDVGRAGALRAAGPVLSVDTGMQRFACPAGQIEAVLEAGECREAFTHATTLARVARLVERVGHHELKLHAAGSSLLAEPEARLDAVRPGLALYAGAVRASTRLVEERKSDGPVGYTGFAVARHGVILAGYSNGLRPGPCLINGRKSRVIEVGMQSAFVETGGGDRVGDGVVLLGDGLSEMEVAGDWKVSPQEVLMRLCAGGMREYHAE